MFDDRLKQLRVNKGLNMKQASAMLNMAYTTYVSYEKDEREPNSEVLILLADFYGCSVDYLVGRSSKKATNKSEQIQDLKQIQLNNNYQKLNESGKNKLIEYSEDLVNSGNYVIQAQKNKRA